LVGPALSFLAGEDVAPLLAADNDDTPPPPEPRASAATSHRTSSLAPFVSATIRGAAATAGDAAATTAVASAAAAALSCSAVGGLHGLELALLQGFPVQSHSFLCKRLKFGSFNEGCITDLGCYCLLHWRQRRLRRRGRCLPFRLLVPCGCFEIDVDACFNDKIKAGCVLRFHFFHSTRTSRGSGSRIRYSCSYIRRPDTQIQASAMPPSSNRLQPKWPQAKAPLVLCASCIRLFPLFFSFLSSYKPELPGTSDTAAHEVRHACSRRPCSLAAVKFPRFLLFYDRRCNSLWRVPSYEWNTSGVMGTLPAFFSARSISVSPGSSAMGKLTGASWPVYIL